ncbi:hypothetical protein WOLCODRAFT_154080 [Wolfiporia cocos MD-104 SS10]|uniref:F-box domain-containing protein n=1 Tax=Wolfiporia cocos (strain MD-104) TaxID=742152 RepID=A0A2H3JVM1_WOLCO|nr:hypothetical protein WOLCODRAFT_154080 [Wolfiporia cocos MD-104 SS10]
METKHLPSSLASRYLNSAPPISIPQQEAIKIRNDRRDERAAHSAFDIEARLLREIEWRPSREWRALLPSRQDAALPQFYSETAASRIPIEIWDKILGYLANEQETLGIAEEGSAPEEGKQRSRAENQRSLAHVGTFAAMFASGQLPRVSSLHIQAGEWTPGAIAQSVFLHLSAFHSITHLELSGITLPSIAVLLRLVCAFDRLESLRIVGLQLLDRRVPPASRRWAPSPNFKRCIFHILNWPDEVRTLDPHGELETSGGSETVLFLSNAVSCSDLKQLLHHAGKALYTFSISPLQSLSGGDSRSIQPLRVPDVNLSRNVSLRTLGIAISGENMPPALLEKVGTYDVIQRMISSTCPTVLEKITIVVWLNLSAASPLIMSHVLLALRRAVCPHHPLAPERYTSMKLVELQFLKADRTLKMQMEADWDRLVPIWFPSFYSREIIK